MLNRNSCGLLSCHAYYQIIKESNNSMFEWLLRVHESWYKHAFSYYKICDVLVNKLLKSIK